MIGLDSKLKCTGGRHRWVKSGVIWSQDVLLVSLNNLAAEGPLRAFAKSALHTSQLHETIMVSNLNEMLLLWNQWIDENASQLSISHLGCVFVCARLQACGTTCLSYTLLGAMSLLQHHLFIWQSLLSVTGNMRSEAGAARALSISVCTHQHHRSTAVFDTTSLGSANL